MKISTLLFLLFLFKTCLVFAQEFTPGFLITQGQDTIKGYILDRTDGELAHEIYFKNKEDGPAIKYTPADLMGLGFKSGRIFGSKVMPIPGSKDSTSQVFVKNIVRGEIDLYVLRHRNKAIPDFYVYNNSTGKSAFFKKPEKRFLVQNGSSYHSVDRHYLGTLNLVKGEIGNASEPRYYEKRIKKDIIRYNSEFENFPVHIYEEESAYSYDLLFGMPTQVFPDRTIWRVSALINKNKPELTRNFYYTYGAYFEKTNIEREMPVDIRNGAINNGWQIFNVMPIAFKYQMDRSIFQPYGYLGVGIAGHWRSWILIEDFNQAGTRTDFRILPTINVGLGAKIKMGPAALVAEIAPSIRGVILSAGISY